MKINIIRNLDQYNLVISPVEEELKRRGIGLLPTNGQELEQKNKAVAAIAIQGCDYRERKDSKIRFFINHGVSVKGWSVPSGVDVFIGQTAYWADYAKGSLKKRKSPCKVIENTGWPKTDIWYHMLKNKAAIKKEIRSKYGIPDNKKIVSCFPTYLKKDMKNSKATWYRRYNYSAVLNKIPTKYHTFVMAHQMDNTDQFKGSPHKTFIKEYGEERLKYAIAADIIVSDVSGMAIESCTIGIPIILIGNKNHARQFHLKWFNGTIKQKVVVGPIIHPNNLEITLDNVLTNDEYADQRRHWVLTLMGPLDGKCAERVVDEILKILAEKK